jgi:hypothetical protein
MRTVSKSIGAIMPLLCLLATLAMAQTPDSPSRSTTPPELEQQPPTPPQGPGATPSQTREMTCIMDDGKGNCLSAAEANGPTVVVGGKGMKKGDKMQCRDLGNGILCQSAPNGEIK